MQTFIGLIRDRINITRWFIIHSIYKLGQMFRVNSMLPLDVIAKKRFSFHLTFDL